MKFFNITPDFNVTAISDKVPADAIGPEAWWSPTRAGWACRSDFETLEMAQKVAASASNLTGDTYIATDAGEGCYPRYNVIEAPAVGEEVSYTFNGDYYPCGTIVSISKSMKLIVTSTGRKFYRRGQSGAWVNNKIWSMVNGHISRWNPEF